MTRRTFRRGWNRAILVGCVAAGVASWTLAPRAQTPSSSTSAAGPTWLPNGQLARPSDYREWAYVTSGLGMTYGPARTDIGPTPMFDNVFVTPASYREFLKSGAWPDGTMFILEIREADANISINNGGRTQGRVMAIEASVKDRTRFPGGGWGYFGFGGRGGLAASATALPSTASCYSCHSTNTAVDNTFVQFYPTLFEAAQRLGTVKSTYDPARKP